MNNKILSVIIILVLFAAGFLLFMGRSAAPTDLPETETAIEESDSANTDTDNGAEVEEGEIVEITVDASNFSFSEESITVNEGDTVRITLMNTQGVHDLRVEGYDVGTSIINVGQSETFEFVADEVGTFEYYCSVGTHRAMGMVGELIVN